MISRRCGLLDARPELRNIGVTLAPPNHIADAGERQVHAGDEQTVSCGLVKRTFAALDSLTRISVEGDRPLGPLKLERRRMDDVAPDEKLRGAGGGDTDTRMPRRMVAGRAASSVKPGTASPPPVRRMRPA